jgi:hypothetical protein
MFFTFEFKNHADNQRLKEVRRVAYILLHQILGYKKETFIRFGFILPNTFPLLHEDLSEWHILKPFSGEFKVEQS